MVKANLKWSPTQVKKVIIIDQGQVYCPYCEQKIYSGADQIVNCDYCGNLINWERKEDSNE